MTFHVSIHGGIIKADRTKQGMSQYDLARRLRAAGFQIGQTAISKIEGGSRRDVGLTTAYGFHMILGISWSDLLLVERLGEISEKNVAENEVE